MLPSRYYPDFQGDENIIDILLQETTKMLLYMIFFFSGNTYERVAHSIASQLFPDVEMVFDYDQLLDKTPCKLLVCCGRN